MKTKPTQNELKRFIRLFDKLFNDKVDAGMPLKQAEDEAILEASTSIFGSGTGTD